MFNFQYYYNKILFFLVFEFDLLQMLHHKTPGIVIINFAFDLVNKKMQFTLTDHGSSDAILSLGCGDFILS